MQPNNDMIEPAEATAAFDERGLDRQVQRIVSRRVISMRRSLTSEGTEEAQAGLSTEVLRVQVQRRSSARPKREMPKQIAK